MAATKSPKTVNMKQELGVTGLKRFGNHVHEEFLRDLMGIRGVRVFHEMAENDDTVGAVLAAIRLLCRAVDWNVEAFSEDQEDQDSASFVKECMDDMDRPWSELITEILSMLEYGWSFHEVIYKYRNGWNIDPAASSKYSDGKLGWKKIPIRSQDTLYGWEFAEDGSILAMIQQAPPTYRLTTIPMGKGLLFRTTTHKNNPEGRSILRNAYRPWFMKRHIENVEAIGVERDLAGIPIAWVPPHIMGDDSSDEDKRAYQTWKTIVTNIKRDEQEGIVMPLAYDADGNKIYDLTLLASAGERAFNTGDIIKRYMQGIAQTSLADFLLIGHEAVGSYALSSSKTTLFSVAIGAYLAQIAEIFNRTAIPDLMRYNGLDPAKSPRVSHGDVETVDLGQLGTFIQALSSAGVSLFPDTKLENWIKRQAGMPVSEHHDNDPAREEAERTARDSTAGLGDDPTPEIDPLTGESIVTDPANQDDPPMPPKQAAKTPKAGAEPDPAEADKGKAAGKKQKTPKAPKEPK